MAILGSEILELREAYREAKSKIEENPDSIEHAVGLAAHRLEATATYQRLMSTAAGLSDSEFQPLKEYVASLSGGENVEMAVEWLDAKAKDGARAALKTLYGVMVGIPLAGAAAIVVGVVAQTLQGVGAQIYVLLATGGSAVVFLLMRSTQVAGTALGETWKRGWTWADGLGKWSDSAMTKARSLQSNLWRATGASLPPTPFTVKARRRAHIVLGAGWLLVAIGVVLVAIGFLRAYNS